MKPDNRERREQFIIRWSPVLLLLSLAAAALSVWREPVSAAQFLFMVSFGLLYGLIAILYWRRPSILILILGAIIVVAGGEFARYYFHPNDSMWSHPLQFYAFVFAGFFGLLTSLRVRQLYKEKGKVRVPTN